MTYLVNLFNREPVRCAAFIRAVILCAVGFGVAWTPEQVALIMIMVEAFFAMITRSQVEPNLNTDNQIAAMESRKRRMINEELDRRMNNEPKV